MVVLKKTDSNRLVTILTPSSCTGEIFSTICWVSSSILFVNFCLPECVALGVENWRFYRPPEVLAEAPRVQKHLDAVPDRSQVAPGLEKPGLKIEDIDSLRCNTDQSG